MRTLYSAGYRNLSLDAFCAFIAREGLVVADVRLRPYSILNPTWNQKALVQRLGDRYAWIPELGNLNYKGGPIALQNEAGGLERVRALLRDTSVVVLCVCPDAATCHRTVVINKLAAEAFVGSLPELGGPLPEGGA